MIKVFTKYDRIPYQINVPIIPPIEGEGISDETFMDYLGCELSFNYLPYRPVRIEKGLNDVVFVHYGA